jgi:hypothetical protein
MTRSLLTLSLLTAGAALAADCPLNTVRSGHLSVDKNQVSLWYTTNPTAIAKIKTGAIGSASDLIALGAVQKGTMATGFDFGPGCDPFNAAGCKNVYAVSLPRVEPSQFMNYFTAAAFCRNSDKRLLTNAEWQATALGTPDPGTADNQTTQCNIGSSGKLAMAGARSACVSDVGAHDMVGNLVEIVADWGAITSAGTGQLWPGPGLPGDFGKDVSLVDGGSGANPYVGLPAATLRGGGYQLMLASPGTTASGVFAIDQNGVPASVGSTGAGTRCGVTPK